MKKRPIESKLPFMTRKLHTNFTHLDVSLNEASVARILQTRPADVQIVVKKIHVISDYSSCVLETI